MADTFTCANCGGAFEKDWTDEEAVAESVLVFGDLEPDDQAIVCDDCYVMMTELLPPADYLGGS